MNSTEVQVEVLQKLQKIMFPCDYEKREGFNELIRAQLQTTTQSVRSHLIFVTDPLSRSLCLCVSFIYAVC